MNLRPRQTAFVQRSLDALKDHRNVLGVAPTGAGKTVMLSAVATRFDRVLVLQHRDELTTQNLRTFKRFGSAHSVGIVDGETKAFSAAATFAMVPTLCRESSLGRMRPVDLVVVDEAHHATAASYAKIFAKARELNPGVRLFGVTATPNRGDGTGLGLVFDHVSDQITIGELIASGHLVQPRCYVVDVGVTDKLARVHKTRSGEYDMDEVGDIMAAEVVFDEIVRHWREKAGDRRTVVFAPTVAYAHAFAERLQREGVNAEAVDGETEKWRRDKLLRDIGTGDLQVLVNVAVATEGWDCPPVSCVVLLRPSSYKSTMMQMIGRGLRPCSETEFPGVVKTDCVVLDFGQSLLRHKGILQTVNLTGNGQTVTCPECAAKLPPTSLECPLCGAVIRVPTPEDEEKPEPRERPVLGNVQLIEIDPFTVVEQSPFVWHPFNERTLVASGFNFSAVVFKWGGAWHACALEKNPDTNTTTVVKLAAGTEGVAVSAADDWMREHAEVSACGKNKRWLNEPPSDKQREQLGLSAFDFSVNRYAATCALTMKFHGSKIKRAYGMP